jgi:ankyrin repeat protein
MLQILGLMLYFNSNSTICRSPFDEAIGYSEIVTLLLKCGANITSYAKSPLYVSVKVGNTDIVSILLENNHFDPSQYDTFHQTPLFIASSNGDLQIVVELNRIVIVTQRSLADDYVKP